MALTEEQRERIQKNKERALAIRKKREEEKLKTGGNCASQEHGSNNTTCTASEKNVPPAKTNEINVDKLQDDAPVEYEDFEIDASPFVSKQEASEKYCLPKGTLDVCEFIEKDNPRNAKFSKMKLYYRTEIRRRARERFGGLDGLIEERSKREYKRFQRDFDDVNDIFNSHKTTRSAKKKRKK